jgi:hypothetical protein
MESVTKAPTNSTWVTADHAALGVVVVSPDLPNFYRPGSKPNGREFGRKQGIADTSG